MLATTSSKSLLPKIPSVAKKALLLGSLYFTQAIPKGYVRYLPIVLAERGETLRKVSFVAFLSWGDWLKPFFGMFMDLKRFSSMKRRKIIILWIQAAIISLLLMTSLIPHLSYEYILILYSLCNFLSSVHDTAVDGFAVNYLNSPTERAYGGFGQYFGYKLGVLVPSGLLPLIFGNDSKSITISASLIMITLFLSVFFHQVPETNGNEEQVVEEASRSTSFERMFTLLSEKSVLINLFIMFIYKFADHGLDFVWGPTLIAENISRKVIVQTQFLVGTIAAIFGSMFGTFLANYFSDSSLALAIAALFRIFPNLLQLLFLNFSIFKTERFIGVHALLENFIGSTVTGCMLSYLLDSSNANFPALSYAFFNSINLIGMSAGEFTFAQLSGIFSISRIIQIGIFINLLFSFSIFLRPKAAVRNNNDHERKLS